MKIKKGDTVVVLTGKDKGRQAQVERASLAERTVTLPGINLYKKHVKKQTDRPGEIVSLPRPLDISKVALFCFKCKQPTRVGYRIVGNKKIRVCRKCDNEIEVVKTETKVKELKPKAKPKNKK